MHEETCKRRWGRTWRRINRRNGYYVVDERHLAEDDLPSDNSMTSVVQLERLGGGLGPRRGGAAGDVERSCGPAAATSSSRG